VLDIAAAALKTMVNSTGRAAWEGRVVGAVNEIVTMRGLYPRIAAALDLRLAAQWLSDDGPQYTAAACVRHIDTRRAASRQTLVDVVVAKIAAGGGRGTNDESTVAPARIEGPPVEDRALPFES
jgi:hypothetical protein